MDVRPIGSRRVRVKACLTCDNGFFERYKDVRVDNLSSQEQQVELDQAANAVIQELRAVLSDLA